MSLENLAYAFGDLSLEQSVLKAVEKNGYSTPTPVQASTIGPMLAGRDVIAQAQTGTGKTAAFALPLLSQMDVRKKEPQVLVLTPTRELAIQVAGSFEKYGSFIPQLSVLPVYGGQNYDIQFARLKRGVHVVVGTPGRIMDHMRRKTLCLDHLTALVLDEADEMLHMGFIDDVEWVLANAPGGIQKALFSATMPMPIRRIAKRHLHEPQEITFKSRPTAAETISQRYCIVKASHKFEALTRILEVEQTDGVIVFMRTKLQTVALADDLAARGFKSAALNGDLAQRQRELTISKLKAGKLDILVATDVAARGLDVDRISHVINYDSPQDTEAYVHRIGRTGRAGRPGCAILFLTPRERGLLNLIERCTKQEVAAMAVPSARAINQKRVETFKNKINTTIEECDLDLYRSILEEHLKSHADLSPLDVAAALVKLYHGNEPFLIKNDPMEHPPRHEEKNQRGIKHGRTKDSSSKPEPGMERYCVSVGRTHGVKPTNIVGAIANEADLDSRYIGRINIFNTHSTVDLPAGMPKSILRLLRKVWVCEQQLRISRSDTPDVPQKTRRREKIKRREARRAS